MGHCLIFSFSSISRLQIQQIVFRKGFEASISCQPYVKDVKITILKDKISGDKTDEFDYDEISAPLIDAEIILEYKNTRVKARVKWIEKLQYPLMFIEKIESIT